jgi:predicted RNA binding protein YcfA (HicA-like mRNA interferase family)
VATSDKRLAAIRRNPRAVRFDDLKAVLEAHGFEALPGKGDHWVFRHSHFRPGVSIDPHKPHVLVTYVKAALKAIDAVLDIEE